MDTKIYNILNLLEENNYECYIVGGYVRDAIMNKKSYDIDICTTASVKELSGLLKGRINNAMYGAFKMNIPPYNIDITTYRVEFSYNKRHPTITYTDDINCDIKRRDFTINTILMDKNGNIKDLLGGLEDIRNKKIRAIGNPNEKFIEDPLRMLRALRFYATLNFSIEKETLNALKKNKELLSTLSKTRIKSELDKILLSPNVVKSLDYLKKLGILKILNIKYKKLKKVDDLCGMYAQLEVPSDYPFTKKEQNNIKTIQKILKYGKIDNTVIYNYGLYYAMTSGLIKGIDRKVIAQKEKDIPIHNRKEIDITYEEVINLGISKNKLNKVYSNLEKQILLRKLRNDKVILTNYITKNKKRWCNDAKLK